MPSPTHRLLADAYVRKLFDAIQDGWETGTINRSAARSRAEVRYSTAVWCWTEALEILTGVKAASIEDYAIKAMKSVTPSAGGRKARDEAVLLFMASIGYARADEGAKAG